MSIIKQVESNFPHIALNDANGNITGVNFNSLSNVSLGDIANVHILGGTQNQSLTTDGSGNLSWAQLGVRAPNSAWVDTGWRAIINFPPAVAGFNFIFTGQGDLGTLAPVGTPVRFNITGPIYTVAFVQRVGATRFRMTFTTATSQTIGTGDPFLIIGDGVVSQLLPGTGITFNSDANTGTLTINSNTSFLVNGTSNIDIPTANANLVFSVNGRNNVANVSNNRISISRGVGAINTATDEYISLGANTATNTVALGINSAASQYSGIRISKSGTERYFIGTDSTTANGNFVVNNPNSFYSSSSLRMTEAGITYRMPPLLYYTSTASQSVNNGTDFSPSLSLNGVGTTKYSSTVTEAQFGISYNSGSRIWTFNTPGVYLMTFTVTFSSNSVGGRTAWIADNSGIVLSRMAVPGLASPLVNGITVTAQAFMASGSQLTLNVNQTSGGTLNIGGVAGYPTTLSIVRL